MLLPLLARKEVGLVYGGMISLMRISKLGWLGPHLEIIHHRLLASLLTC
jgi:hypothetical protein